MHCHIEFTKCLQVLEFVLKSRDTSKKYVPNTSSAMYCTIQTSEFWRHLETLGDTSETLTYNQSAKDKLEVSPKSSLFANLETLWGLSIMQILLPSGFMSTFLPYKVSPSVSKNFCSSAKSISEMSPILETLLAKEALPWQY